jgi:NADPH:quinone reductase-like Zn-dependent oxidoreductase
MKAVRIYSFGGPEVMKLEDVPIPAPAPGEVLIRVEAASVNPVDYKIRSGEFKPAGIQIPLTLGRDVSGVVEQTGRDVPQFSTGDPVYALLDRDHGSYAEFVVAKAEHVVRKPEKLDYLHAAAVPLAAMTAWQGLFDHGRLKAGERVLIHGAAGGVGHFAVQFAKDRGAYVIATARAEDRELLRKWGADEIIDYKKERFEDRARDVDLVLDLVAGETQTRSWRTLKRGGRLVSTLQPPSQTEAALHQAKAEAFMVEPNSEQLAKIGDLIDRGKVSVFLQQTFPISEVRQAHEHLEHEHVRGKVALAVRGGRGQ